MENWGLSKGDIDLIRTIFEKYPTVEKVQIYGSRAMGTFKPASDIDLTFFGKNIDLNLQQVIEFELDDLMLPYKFDISIYDKINNPDLMAHIDKEGQIFFKKIEHITRKV